MGIPVAHLLLHQFLMLARPLLRRRGAVGCCLHFILANKVPAICGFVSKCFGEGLWLSKTCPWSDATSPCRGLPRHNGLSPPCLLLLCGVVMHLFQVVHAAGILDSDSVGFSVINLQFDGKAVSRLQLEAQQQQFSKSCKYPSTLLMSECNAVWKTSSACD